MEFKHPIKITNWSMEANAYRNMNRPKVDELINKADKLQNNALFNKENSKQEKLDLQKESDRIRNQALQLWRTIINTSNNFK